MRRAQSTFTAQVHAGDEVIEVEFEPRVTASNLATVIRIIRAGMGIGPLPMPLIDEELERKELEVVLPGYFAAPIDLLALYQERRHVLPSVRVFIDRLAEHARRLEEEHENRSNHPWT